MCKVYESAYFTIIAASTKSSHSSFLNRKNAGQRILERQNDGRKSLKARRPLFLGIHTVVDQFKQDPLDDIAWPLQERILARGAMIFSTEEAQ